jgi:hypothetical protein
MNPKIISKKKRPEGERQDRIEKYLTDRGWSVRSTHGNMYMAGFPDLYVCHRNYGSRWIEVKNPDHFVFTPAQLEYFPELGAHGVGVWILIDGTEEEYKKLFRPYNWWQFLQ